MRASRKFLPFPTAKPQHHYQTSRGQQTGHFKRHTERYRKHQKGNMLYHHQSQQTDHQLPSLDKVKELLEKGANMSAAFDTVYYGILLFHFLV